MIQREEELTSAAVQADWLRQINQGYKPMDQSAGY